MRVLAQRQAERALALRLRVAAAGDDHRRSESLRAREVEAAAARQALQQAHDAARPVLLRQAPYRQ